MAIIETKIIQIDNSPSTINDANEEWGHFGWVVQNVQVTHSQDTRTYTKGLDYYTGDKTVETTTINYATITYQRDKQMPNYSKLVQLEAAYSQVLDKLAFTTEAQQVRFGEVVRAMKPLDIVLSVALLPAFYVGIVYFVLKYRKVKQTLQSGARQYDGEIQELLERRDAIIQKAESLLA